MSTPLEPDGSRLEAAEAGLRQEVTDGAQHVEAADALPTAGVPTHRSHVPADPNEGVVRADPPSGKALLAAAAVAAVTIVALVLLALALARAG